MNIFEQASKLKLRFESPVGTLRVEDLWDLRLETLNTIAIAYHEKIDAGKISFIETKAPAQGQAQLHFDITKHIIDVKLAEREEARLAHANAAKKQKLLEIVSRKQDEELSKASLDELQKMISEL